MAKTLKEYIDPNTGKPDDRSWLYDQIHDYVESMQSGERSEVIVQEDIIYLRFAPISGRTPPHLQNRSLGLPSPARSSAT